MITRMLDVTRLGDPYRRLLGPDGRLRYEMFHSEVEHLARLPVGERVRRLVMLALAIAREPR